VERRAAADRLCLADVSVIPQIPDKWIPGEEGGEERHQAFPTLETVSADI